MSKEEFNGFLELEEELKEIIEKVENKDKYLEEIAQDFVKDLLKLPKPKSKINRSGYTHLISTFSYAKRRDEIEIGWGKYYGMFVEKGTKTVVAQPHLQPMFEKNFNKYIEKINKKLNL